jgi:hypothetical protein
MKTLLILAALAVGTSGLAFAKDWTCTKYITNYVNAPETHCNRIVARNDTLQPNATAPRSEPEPPPHECEPKETKKS